MTEQDSRSGSGSPTTQALIDRLQEFAEEAWVEPYKVCTMELQHLLRAAAETLRSFQTENERLTAVVRHETWVPFQQYFLAKNRAEAAEAEVARLTDRISFLESQLEKVTTRARQYVADLQAYRGGPPYPKGL